MKMKNVMVNVTIMLAWCLSFLPNFGEKNISYNGHENHEIECVVAPYI
jgi:hypothetical protein